MEWFLLKISKKYILTRSTSLRSRNHSMLCFWLRGRIFITINFMIKVQKQPFADVLKNFTIFTRKYLCWNLFVLQLQSSSPATTLKSNSSTGVFLWILPNFKEHLFWKTSMNGCFWNLMKKLFDHEILSFWTCYEEHISCAFYKVIAPTQVVKALLIPNPVVPCSKSLGGSKVG